MFLLFEGTILLLDRRSLPTKQQSVMRGPVTVTGPWIAKCLSGLVLDKVASNLTLSELLQLTLVCKTLRLAVLVRTTYS
jgi:hypothetical protein